MSVAGGRGPGALWRARALPLLLVVLLALPALPLVAPPADAQSTGDPWWGPSDVTAPTKGWAVRVPLIVENDRTYALQDPFVAAEVDFGKLLVEAGWTSRTTGTETTVRGFTLDVDSLRVVEYQSGFSGGPIKGVNTPPTPHFFYKAAFTAPHKRDFDPANNPSGTVLFQVQGALQPQQRRYYYVYANPLEYGKTEAPRFDLAARAPLDAFLWGTPGTAYYGYEPAQTGLTHQINVRALTNEPTKAVISVFNFGKFTPIPSNEQLTNPYVMNSGQNGNTWLIRGIPSDAKWKIEADKPILVQTTGVKNVNAPNAQSEAWGFVPALNGSYAGTDFWVWGAKNTIAGNQLVAYRAEGYHGSITITVGSNDLDPMSPADHKMTVPVTLHAWNHITAKGGNILLSLGNATAADTRKPAVPFPTFPVPSLTGGATGDDFYVVLPHDGGYLYICPEEPVKLRVVDAEHPTQQYMPQGPVDSTPPTLLAPETGCITKTATGTTPETTLEVYSLRGDDGSPPGRFRVLVGAKDRTNPEDERGMLGNYAGPGGIDFWVDAPVGVFGVYNDTRVATSYPREHNGVKLAPVNGSTFAVSDGSLVVLPKPTSITDATGKIHIVSTKPISVVSLDSPYDQSYAHSVPGRPLTAHATLGHAEFRGPLVEVRSREKPGRQDFRSAGPGSPVTFPLEVANLGQWMAGASLPDTIQLTCTGPEGWSVDGCGKELRLGSREAARTDITITPPSDAVNVNGTFVVQGRSKAAPNVTSEFKLIVFVEIRYGVGLWFDEVGGRKTFDPPAEVNPGGTYPYKIVIKNTGSARDTFDLAVTPGPRPGWSQALTLDGEPVTKVTLDAGASRTLDFAVTAPNAESAQQNLVSISAQSETSALAADVVNTATRIRPKVNIALTVDPTTRIAAPNETAVFNLTVNNSGNDIFRITFREDSLLPKGWTAELGVTEIDLSPGTPFTFPLRVTPPIGARANDLATVKIAAETDTGSGGASVPGDVVSAVVVVKKIHCIGEMQEGRCVQPPLLDEPARPGATLDYTLNVTNAGNGADSIELLPGAVTPPTWKVTLPDRTLALDAGASDDLRLSIVAPPGAPPGPVNLTFTLRLSREATQNLTIPMLVAEAAQVSFEGLGNALAMAPARAQTLSLTATNVGNVEGTFALNATLPDGWRAAFTPERVKLAPGASYPVTLVLNASRDAADGAYDLALTASLDGRPAGTNATNATLARPELYLAKVDATGNVASGELVLVTASVGNRGGIAAENVTVELVVDGEPVDTVTIARISVDDTKVATLHWLATKRTADVRVVLDPDQTIVESGDLADHAATVKFGSTLPLPAPALPLALALLLALTLLRRRRS